MTDIAVIQSIQASGGWCQLYHPNGTPLKDQMGGRLLRFTPDFSLIEKFDLNTNSLRGYFIVLNFTKQRLTKGSWIKKMLSIGGKIITDPNRPELCNADNLQEILSNLKSRKELVNIKTREEKICGRLTYISDKHLTIDDYKFHASVSTNIPLSGISYIEWQTYSIQQILNR